MTTRVAIVTGAASGIGRAIAEGMAQAGYNVVVADLPTQPGQEVADAIGGHFVAGNLAKRADCRQLIDATLERYGRIDVIVNNAGFQHIDSIVDFPEDVWETMQAVMVTAPFLLTKYAWPTLQSQNWGRIINISSALGLVGAPFKASYVAAKHGVIGLTRTIALEGGPYGITANAICPAYVRTPLLENQIADQARTRNIAVEDVVEKVMLAPTAIKRLIEPSEIASMVLYLCSDAAGAVTGTSLSIDLGWTTQ